MKVLIRSEWLLDLPDYEITKISDECGIVVFSVVYLGAVSCIHCGGSHLRNKDRRERVVRHGDVGRRPCILRLVTRKWRCLDCGHYFWQRFPGILPRRRMSEPFRRDVSTLHLDGINRRVLSQREGIGSATVSRLVHEYLKRRISERQSAMCPRILGIDEHFFSRRHGYATTLCDLGRRKVFDVVLGRSEASLEGYLNRLKGKENVRVVCMDLCASYRSLVRKYFPNAKIVADRFHVIRLVNHHFLNSWKLIDPVGAKSRGLLSLMRRHQKNLKSPEQFERLMSYLKQFPGLQAIYLFKQQLCQLLLHKHCNAKKCKSLIPKFLDAIDKLKNSRIEPLVTLGQTLDNWKEEIATMWRFTKNNGITEGFHNKMETISRQAYGYRNFENYRLRVRVTCS